MAFWLSQVDQKGMEQAITDATKEGAQAFVTKFKVKKDMMHLRKQPPDQRLAVYMARTDAIWNELRAVFPMEYQAQSADWRLLEMKVMRGEMSPPPPPSLVPPVSPYAPSAQPYDVSGEVEGLKGPVKAQGLTKALFPPGNQAVG